ncbi:MAG: signal peptide peptidase SppA [Acidobacteria bacterium]|nr:signal peptide peptidase SppA [Acidobacteriota bacterium]
MIRPGKVLLLLGAIAALVAAGALVVALAVWIGKPGVPGQTILEIDLERGIVAQLPDDPVARLASSGAQPLRDVIEAIERAEGDKRVVGLFARIGAGNFGMATAQELRDAILAFRKAGKPAFAFAETFGEFGPGNRGYYLATGFDEVWLQPSGDIGLIGVEMWTPFLKGTLDKLGVVPRMDHRYEYKNAMNTFTESVMTPPHREAMQAIADGWFEQLVAGIASGRKLPEAEVRALIHRGPFLGEEAVKARLVDGLGYRDEVVEKFKAKLTGKPSLIYLPAYLEAAGRPHDSGKKIALIYGVGGVSRGRSSYDPLMQDLTMGSDTVTAAFRAAVADKKVKAILFRVDSPGGSYVASDAIWREVVLARLAGKPVIVSMGDVAGSGGYFVAMAADKIVAQPGTITGSIGVLGGKMLTSALWDKGGVSWDSVHQGDRAGMFSTGQDFTPEEWQRFQAWLDRVYSDFTGKVAEGRKLPLERVQEIAKGRIWTGADAKRLGLVDELGGLREALNLARRAAGLTPEDAIEIAEFPAPRGMFGALLGGEDRSSEPTTRIELRALETLRTLERVAAPLSSRDGEAVLRMAIAPEGR